MLLNLGLSSKATLTICHSKSQWPNRHCLEKEKALKKDTNRSIKKNPSPSHQFYMLCKHYQHWADCSCHSFPYSLQNINSSKFTGKQPNTNQSTKGKKQTNKKPPKKQEKGKGWEEERRTKNLIK